MFIFVTNNKSYKFQIMRKQLLLFLLACGSYTYTYSQSFILEHNNVDYTNDTVIFYDTIRQGKQRFEYKKFLIINPTQNAMTIKVRRTEELIIPNTADALCWGASCFDDQLAGTNPVWEPDDITTSNGNDTLTGDFGFVVYHESNKIPGESLYKYEFYDIDSEDQVEGILFVRVVTINAVGLNELDREKYTLNIHPNPASDFISLNYNFERNFNALNFKLYTILGEKVYEKSILKGNGNLRISTEKFPSGIYFYLIEADGLRTASKKLVIHK